MTRKYPRVYTQVDEKSLTETEHTDSCDPNLMLKNAARGQQIRGGGPTTYGHDDLTMDGLTHRINKANSEAELREIAETHEFTQEELDQMPKKVQEKFKFKVRKKEETKLAPKNDDQTTKNEPPKPPLPPEPLKPQ